jgi:hypothetical protein
MIALFLNEKVLYQLRSSFEEARAAWINTAKPTVVCPGDIEMQYAQLFNSEFESMLTLIWNQILAFS